MEIIFYNNRSSKETLNKTITETFRISGTLREASSVIDPVIEISADGSITKSCNYAYIPQFGRYYFINDIVSVKNNLWRISMHVDVLMSFNEEIKNSFAHINISENNHDDYIYNDRIVQSEQNVSTVSVFPNGFNDNGEYILITAGG